MSEPTQFSGKESLAVIFIVIFCFIVYGCFFSGKDSESEPSKIKPNLDLFESTDNDQTLKRARAILPQFDQCPNGDKITPKKNADIKQMALDNIQGYLSEKNKVLSDSHMYDNYLKSAHDDPTWHNALYNIEEKLKSHLNLLKIRCDIAQESKSNNVSKIEVSKTPSKEPVDSPEDTKLFNNLDVWKVGKISAFAQFPSPIPNGIGKFIQANHLSVIHVDGFKCYLSEDGTCYIEMYLTKKRIKYNKHQDQDTIPFCGSLLSYTSSKKDMTHWTPVSGLATALAEGNNAIALLKIENDDSHTCPS